MLRAIFLALFAMIYTSSAAIAGTTTVSGESGIYRDLSRAIIDGDEKKVRYLLDNGAEVAFQIRGDGQLFCYPTPLHLAAEHGQATIVSLLLSRSASPNVYDRCEYTPLMYAAEYGHIGIINMLLKSGAIVATRNKKGKTALDLAREKKSPKVTQVLEKAYFAQKRRAAEQGDVLAQNWLGVMYGAKDPAKAVKWFRKAAEQGYARAQINLGHHYKKGEGVTKNLAKAMKWYRRAAEQKQRDSSDAQIMLGKMYEKGEGVAKDLAVAMKWYREATDLGNSEVQHILAWYDATLSDPRLLAGGDIYRNGVSNVPPCGVCHGKDGSGNGIPAFSIYPPGRFVEIISTYASGNKGDKATPLMNSIAKRLSPDEIEALSHYVSWLRNKITIASLTSSEKDSHYFDVSSEIIEGTYEQVWDATVTVLREMEISQITQQMGKEKGGITTGFHRRLPIDHPKSGKYYIVIKREGDATRIDLKLFKYYESIKSGQMEPRNSRGVNASAMNFLASIGQRIQVYDRDLYAADINNPSKELEGRATIVNTAMLRIGTNLVRLNGIVGEDGDAASRMQSFIEEQGEEVHCKRSASNLFVCKTANGIDIAAAALMNGAAKTAADAPAEYRKYEKESRSQRLGIWGN